MSFYIVTLYNSTIRDIYKTSVSIYIVTLYDSIIVEAGIRQGCPLFFLFSFLLATIFFFSPINTRYFESIKGLMIGKQEIACKYF